MNTDNDPIRKDINDLCASIALKILGSRGLRRLILTVAKNSLEGWAKKGSFRRRISYPGLKVLSSMIAAKRSPSEETISADAGRLATLYAAKINADHTKDPTIHALRRDKPIRDFITSTDFGEIREMVQRSQACVIKTIEILNDNIWRYPAKVGSILGSLLCTLNTSIKAAHEAIKPIEKNIGPDLFADLILSLLKGIDGKEAGALANSVNELIRRLHTGSLLLAKGGKPLFEVYLTSILKDAASAIDPELLTKARTAIAEDRQAAAYAYADVLSKNPGLLLGMISAYGAVRNPDINAFSRKTRMLEEIDDIDTAMAHGISDIDTYEISQIINSAAKLFNKTLQKDPDLLFNLVRGIVDSIDFEEVRSACEKAGEDMAEALKPFAPAFMPAFLGGIADMISPDHIDMDPRQEVALKKIGSAFRAAGGEA